MTSTGGHRRVVGDTSVDGSSVDSAEGQIADKMQTAPESSARRRLTSRTWW
jgi:hypothetical protein